MTLLNKTNITDDSFQHQQFNQANLETAKPIAQGIVLILSPLDQPMDISSREATLQEVLGELTNYSYCLPVEQDRLKR
jgi:hypothetical protein